MDMHILTPPPPLQKRKVVGTNPHVLVYMKNWLFLLFNILIDNDNELHIFVTL